MTKLLMNARKNNPTVLDMGQTTWRRNSPIFRIGQFKNGSALAKGGGQKKKVSILHEPELFSEIHVPSSNPRTFRKYNQSCIARPCTVTTGFYRVDASRRKRKRIEVHSASWFDCRMSQSQNR